MEANDTNGTADDVQNSKTDDFFDTKPAKGAATESSEPESAAEGDPTVNGDTEESGHQEQTAATPEVENGTSTEQNGQVTVEQPEDRSPTPKENGVEAEEQSEPTPETPSDTKEENTEESKEEITEEEKTEESKDEKTEESNEEKTEEANEEKGEESHVEKTEEANEEKTEEANEEKTEQSNQEKTEETGVTTDNASEPTEVPAESTDAQQQDGSSKASNYDDDDDFSNSTEAAEGTPSVPPTEDKQPTAEAGGYYGDEEKTEEQPESKEANEEWKADCVSHQWKRGVTEQQGNEQQEEEGRSADAAVEPVEVEQPDVKTDGRSTPGIDEKEGNRGEDRSEEKTPEGSEDSRGQGQWRPEGEDRSEEKAPEGSEDSRGQGQWRPEGEQVTQDAVMAQQSDKEQLEAVREENLKLQEECDALRSRLEAQEQELDKKSDQLVVSNQLSAEKDSKMRVMEEELEILRLHTADSDTVEIKDLQERLAILARENEEKDRRVVKLEEDLRDTTGKLRETERRLFAAETSTAAGGGGDAPKSKTCVVM